VALAALGGELAEAVVVAVPGWIERCIAGRFEEWVRQAGSDAARDEPSLNQLAQQAGAMAAAKVDEPLRTLLSQDVDAQRTTPLALVRPLVSFATDVLSRLGVPPVVRDEFQVQRFAEDEYGLTPASLAALGEDVGDLALAWGAAKAMAHRRRHQT
jgi:hypothetical protein